MHYNYAAWILIINTILTRKSVWIHILLQWIVNNQGTRFSSLAINMTHLVKTCYSKFSV